MKEYNRWVQNPSQYGGLETLEQIKDAYEEKYFFLASVVKC